MNRPATATLSVDRIACTGHGLCADWLPERITLDEWGYPIIDPSVPAALVADARRAAAECPMRALTLASALRQAQGA